MFEYYGDIHVYCPGMGAYGPLGSNVFSESLQFSTIAISCKVFTSNDFLTVFPNSNALPSYVDIAVK